MKNIKYVKINESNCSVWALKEMLEREVLYTLEEDVYHLCSVDHPMRMMIAFSEGCVYKKVEVSWQEALEEFLEGKFHHTDRPYVYFDEDGQLTLDGKIPARMMIALCHLVASMTEGKGDVN